MYATRRTTWYNYGGCGLLPLAGTPQDLLTVIESLRGRNLNSRHCLPPLLFLLGWAATDNSSTYNSDLCSWNGKQCMHLSHSHRRRRITVMLCNISLKSIWRIHVEFRPVISYMYVKSVTLCYKPLEFYIIYNQVL